LKGIVASLNKEKKKDILERFAKHCGVQQYLLDYVKHGKEIESIVNCWMPLKLLIINLQLCQNITNT
jgi:hypothetical protein